MATGAQLAQLALTKRGDRYVWGAVGPNQFDCSGLVSWCEEQTHVPGATRRTAEAFRQYCKASGTIIPVGQARGIVGAIGMVLRKNGTAEHIVFSLGNGSTMEAANSRDGCGVFNWDGRFQVAALLPNVDYGNHPAPPPPAPIDWNAVRRLAAAKVLQTFGNIGVPFPLAGQTPNPIFVAMLKQALNLIIPTAGLPADGIWDDPTMRAVFQFQVAMNQLKPGAITDGAPGQFTNLTKFWADIALQNIAQGKA